MVMKKQKYQKFHWKYIRPIDEKNYSGDFPETFRLEIKKNSQIIAEVNRFRGLIRLTAGLPDGSRFQSVISNGTIIREKDLRTGRFRDLENDFLFLKNELSSLPDTEVLRLIGGNYEVLTEFTGTIQKVYKKRSFETVGDLFNYFYHLPIRVFRKSSAYIRSFITLPGFWDIFDTAFCVAIGYGIYQINFNFLHAGLAACIGVLITGFTDMTIRNKSPYVLKLLFVMVPGIYVMYTGYMLH